MASPSINQIFVYTSEKFIEVLEEAFLVFVSCVVCAPEKKLLTVSIHSS